jgi:hypothetical protein
MICANDDDVNQPVPTPRLGNDECRDLARYRQLQFRLNIARERRALRLERSVPATVLRFRQLEDSELFLEDLEQRPDDLIRALRDERSIRDLTRDVVRGGWRFPRSSLDALIRWSQIRGFQLRRSTRSR